MKWKLNLPKPLMMAYYFLKLIGLTTFTVKKDGFEPPTVLNKLYLISVTAAYLYLRYREITDILAADGSNSPSVTGIGYLLIYSIGSLCTFTILLTSLLMHKKVLYIMNKLRMMSSELESLGIEENIGKYIHNRLVIIVIGIFSFIAIRIGLNFMETDWKTMSIIGREIDTFVGFVIIIIFVQMLLFIKHRFTLVNKKLHYVLRPPGFSPRPQVFPVSNSLRGEVQAIVKDLTDIERILKIEALHLDLCDLVDRTTRLFAIPILLRSLQLCIGMMLDSFWILVLTQTPDLFRSSMESSSVMIITYSGLRLIFSIFEIVGIAHTSTKIRKEGNATSGVLFKSWYTFRSQELEDEIVMFSLQMMHKRVSVAIFDFFNLDYSYLYTIFGAVVMYVIAIIQFDANEL